MHCYEPEIVVCHEGRTYYVCPTCGVAWRVVERPRRGPEWPHSPRVSTHSGCSRTEPGSPRLVSLPEVAR